MTRKERWHELKLQYPNAVVLLQNGNFYEAYLTDAATVGKALNIPIKLHKQFGSVCRFPLQRLIGWEYLHTLVRAGNRAAVCDKIK